MSILWIYHSPINPLVGGTERASHSVMMELRRIGYPVAGSLSFSQSPGGKIYDGTGAEVKNLASFLDRNSVRWVVNQIGYSDWLLKEFLQRGGERWRSNGGRIITCLHFAPVMFAESLKDLVFDWNGKNVWQKVRRLGRIALLPYSRAIARKTLREAYRYLLNNSDRYVLLSEAHRNVFEEMTSSDDHSKISIIPNPNTFSHSLPIEQIKSKKKQALIVSRLDENQKRVSLALRAWSEIMQDVAYNDWSLVIVGDGRWKEKYEGYVRERELSNVQFIGRANPEPYYDESSVYFHTAASEGWGLTITEAMQKGVVPVVMNSCRVFEDFIQSGYNGYLVKDASVVDFANTAARLMAQAEQRDRLAAHALQVSNKFDAETIGVKWDRMLRLLESDG